MVEDSILVKRHDSTVKARVKRMPVPREGYSAMYDKKSDTYIVILVEDFEEESHGAS